MLGSLGARKDGKGNAKIIVEIFIRFIYAILLGKHGRYRILRSRFSDTSRNGNDGGAFLF